MQLVLFLPGAWDGPEDFLREGQGLAVRQGDGDRRTTFGVGDDCRIPIGRFLLLHRKFTEAYFSRWPGIWAQGDYGEITPHGGLVIHGRSDAVLNPGGVRIGTAEIYRQVEKIPAVLESVCIGQDWDDDVRVVLFVVLRPK